MYSIDIAYYIYGTPCASDTKTGKYVFTSKFIMFFKIEMGARGGGTIYKS